MIMYSPNGSHNGNIDHPVFYTDQQIYPFCCSPLLFGNDSNQTSNSKQPNYFPLSLPLPLTPLTFSHDSSFPSPFEDSNNNNDAIFRHYQDQLLLHHHQPLGEAANVDMDIEVPSTGSATTKQIPRGRRCGRSSSNKRDRHSKIKTARGLRDRRMRLSIEVAKRFFGLQDMLGFDKASKTVDWLLNQAKEGIKRVARDKNIVIRTSTSNNSSSECERVSWLDEAGSNGDQKEGKPSIKRKIGVSRKGTFHVFARESRVKARERARERTKQKMKSRKLAGAGDESKQNWGYNWNLLAKGEVSNTRSQNVNSSLVNLMTEAEEPGFQAGENLWTVDISDDSLMTMSKWSPSMIFNSLHNSGLLHEHQYAEYQSFGKH